MKPLPIAIIIYGVVNIAGGLFGFAAAHSIWSLVAGVGLGAALVWAALTTQKNPGLGYRTAGIICVLLALFWGQGLFKNLQNSKSIMRPAGNLVMAVSMFAWMGAAHMAATKGHKS